MEFLKNHYEKVILSIVLLGLAVAAAWLPIKVNAVRDALQQSTINMGDIRPKPLAALDTASFQGLVSRAKTPPKLSFGSSGHNVFNPLQWKKKPDGTPVPSTDTGLNALTVTNIAPLHLKIEYQGTRDSGDNIRYQFNVTREAATNSTLRGPVMRVVAVGAKNDVFTLKEAKGPREEPTEFILELVDGKSVVSVSREKPLVLVTGYSADLRYETESKSYLKQRASQKLSLSGVAYNIVAITSSDVTLEDNQTKKRTTIRWSAAP